MTELKTKARKAKYWLKRDFFVFDNVLIFIAIVLCLLWTWGTIGSLSRNWTLAQELISRQRERALLELEVETLELENEYYHSAEYQELAARKYQGRKLPGETMIYLPSNSEAAKTKHVADVVASSPKTKEMSNFEQWMAFLFGMKF